MDTSPSKDSTQIVLQRSAAVVQGLLALGTAIPIIGQFAVVLQKALEVIKQASRNEDAIVRLYDHAVDIIEGLLPHLRDLSRITGFDYAFKKLMDLLDEISTYISNQSSLVTKVMSATDTNLVTQVDIYIKNLTDRKDRLMELIAIDTNRKVTYITEANDKVSEDHRKDQSSNIEVNQAVDSSTDPFGLNVANKSDVEYANKNTKANGSNRRVLIHPNNERSRFQARDTYVKNLSSNK